MTILVHAPTIHALRRELATLRAEIRGMLPSPHREVSGAIDIADTVIGMIDGRFVEMLPEVACPVKAEGAAS